MGQVNERREGIHTQLAQIIFIITFFVYLLKLNVLCRKNKGEGVRQMKEVFFICGVNITVMKVPVQGIAEPV
ncbi:hypothetical protein QTN38_009250 [Enterobacter cloacae subsp. cloacae]|uniref:hypothetical protein n=1 Tax=Enterobacter cloacae TaxID=550 RepID=UPI00197F3EE2|nr:hypothetical protein [Enterobacter cloacae]MBN4757844.1 hypothetical protein [Enterobacter cloacae]MCU6281097.1 hypothetical protein [Enterobacter cloacae]MCU6308684.1 hypothetical protein [Enterobacter cloacae]WLD33850.1 hypothetical protein QTN38_009250 [Enterobacter cloacae subsp. cloacae]HDC4527986.1 hypothetical protein [Enterobacter cloacae]